jgi:hypothetical protein
MMDPQKYENMTVAEALTSKERELKALVDWARTRLERVASLVALSMEPDEPDGDPEAPHIRAQALGMASYLCVGLCSAFEAEECRPDFTTSVERTLDARMDALSQEELDRWDPDRVARMTVGELVAALQAEKKVVTP